MTIAGTDNLASQVKIGSGGKVWVAPIGTVIPANETVAPAAAFKPLGFITEDGVTIRDSKTVQEKRAWQNRYPVKRWVNSRAYEVSFTLEQINWLTFPFAMGGGTLTEPTAGKFKYVPPAPDFLDSRALLIDWSEGAVLYRLFIPEGLVTDNVEFQVQAEDTIELPVTYGAIFNGVDPVYTFLTNDLAFDAS